MYNSFGERSYVTTQSIKKLKKEYRDWALDKSGWRMVGDKNPIFYNLDELEHREELKKSSSLKNLLFMMKIYQIQRLIVTFSTKYQDYHRTIRERQIERASKLLGKPSQATKKRQTDFKRFLKETSTTKGRGNRREKDSNS
ncbi:Uncharacterised protein [Streptococcus pneumoniae]|nr:Uncharacterised protein [Streptococcus pneumoniae]